MFQPHLKNMRQSNWESFPQGIGLGFLKIVELPPPFRHVFFQHLFSPGSIPAPWLVAATSQRRNLSIQLARLRKIPGPRRTKNPGHFTLLQSISKKGNVRKLLPPFIHISGSYGDACIFDFGVLRKNRCICMMFWIKKSLHRNFLEQHTGRLCMCWDRKWGSLQIAWELLQILWN